MSSEGHSNNVTRFFLPATAVIGPLVSVRFWLVYTFTSDRIKVLLPQPAGPITTTRVGGADSSVRSTNGTTSFLWSRSKFLCIPFLVRPILATLKALGLCFSLLRPRFFLSVVFFFSALGPLFLALCFLGAAITSANELISDVFYKRRLRQDKR